MATIGQQFKTAREAKGVSESEAGKATKILTKLIVAMEADDFSEMAAPTYAKGFIRLYAKYLGIDPEPLVELYTQKYGKARKPLISDDSQLDRSTGKTSASSARFKEISEGIKTRVPLKVPTGLFAGLQGKIPTGMKDIRVVAGMIAALLLIIVLSVSISNCARRRAAEKPAPAPTAAITGTEAKMLLDEPIPDLYLVEPGKIESSQ